MHNNAALAHIVEDIYEASYQPEHWSRVLQGIATLTDSDSAAMLYHDHELEQAGGTFAYNIPPETAQRYIQAGPDPNFLIMMERLPLGTAAAIDHIVPDRQALEALYGDFFTGFLAPHDMYHIAGIILFNDAVRTVGIGLQRGRKRGVWEASQIDPLSDLAPHIQRALHIHKEFTRLRMKEQAMQAGLDRLVMGVMLFDQLLQPVYCNPVAQSILEDHPAIQLRNDKLYAASDEDTRAIHTALQKALEADAANEPSVYSTALGLRHKDCHAPLPLLVTPVQGIPHKMEAGVPDAYVALCISDPDKNQPVVPEALHSAYGLTPSESQVAIAIANGLSVDEIASLHGRSTNTIRTQLKAIFNKLGVKRQSELVKVLLSGPFRAMF